MAKSSDFFIAGDHEQGKQVIASALASQGFAVTTTPSGGFLARRGSGAATVWLGAMAGKKFQVSFTVDFFADDKGQLVARLNRDMTSGALKGGAIGANMTNNAFLETGTAIAAALTGANLYAGVVHN